MLTRRQLLAVGLAVAPVALIATRTTAAEPPVFTGLIEGVGAGGYDVVAYQSENTAAKGDPAITSTHDGVAYWFATETSRAAFDADPARYLPAYGGYCAYAVANGYTAKIDPEAFSVVDGRLYLNYSLSVRDRWLKDVPGHIAAANANWPAVLNN
jgi:YHS domain-containing protein